MIKTMIVDDEYLVRQLIIKSFDWTRHGFRIIGEAENGKEALEYIAKLKPDFVIIDINIPFINGIELAKIISKKYSSIKIIILTAYSDFDYARSALEAGVVEYLLKPVEAKPLERVLNKVKESILAERRQKQYINNLENQVTRYRDNSNDTVLKALISGKKAEDGVFRNITDTINIKGENIYSIVIEVDNYLKNWASDADRELWKFSICNIANEIISSKCNCKVFEWNENRIAALAEWDGMVDCLAELCSEVKEAVKQYLNFTVTIGLSRLHTGIRDCRKTFEEAVRALDRKFYEGCFKVFVYDNVDPIFDDDISQYMQSKDEILLRLRLGKLQDIHMDINRVLDEAIRKHAGKSSIIYIVGSYIYVAIGFMKEINVEGNEINKYQNYYMDSLNHLETITDMREYVNELYDRIQNSIKINSNFKLLKIVENAKVYIEDNYANENLSLAEIAEKLYVNASYLSKIFKEQTKYSIIEYLVNFRLNRAKEYMDREKDTQVSEVAYEVGYGDPLYFSKSFKKKYGLSPQRYLKRV